VSWSLHVIDKVHCLHGRWTKHVGLRSKPALERRPSTKNGAATGLPPATMLQTSPTASSVCDLAPAPSAPSIFVAMRAADLLLQRRVNSPHKDPASPTIDVTSREFSGADSGAASKRSPNMRPKTSCAESSSSGAQYSCGLAASASVLEVCISSLPALEGCVPLLDRP